MKYLVLTAIGMLMACSGALAAEQPQGRLSDPAAKTVVFEEAGGAGEKAADAGSGTRQTEDDGGVDDAGTMPPYESYDPNTGLPNKVASDAYGEFD